MANAGNSHTDESTYYEVIYRKTAKLFESAAQIGAILASADQQPMADYGKHLGMAFQIIDDVLDYQGDVSAIGKNVGDDLAEGKMTLPLVHSRDHLDAQQRQLICQAIESKSADNFAEILSAVQSCGSLDYSIEQAKIQAELAKQALVSLPESQFKSVMKDLADFSVSRLS
jgi:octaprenyl-diphosphate synthase